MARQKWSKIAVLHMDVLISRSPWTGESDLPAVNASFETIANAAIAEKMLRAKL